MYSNSSGAVIPLPDSPSPLSWNPTWFPISKKPPQTVEPSSFLVRDKPDCLSIAQQIPKENLVGIFTFFEKPNKYYCRIYRTNAQNQHAWNQWKNQPATNDNMNGIFYIYRPWLHQSTQAVPRQEDKIALAWMIPNDPLPTESSTVEWKCPTQQRKRCAIQKETTEGPRWNDHRITNLLTDPCFFHEKGCQNELNIPNRRSCPNRPNIYLPFSYKDITRTGEYLHPYRFEYLYQTPT